MELPQYTPNAEFTYIFISLILKPYHSLTADLSLV